MNGEEHPINNIKDGYIYLLDRIRYRAVEDIKRYNSGIEFLGDGNDPVVFNRQHPLKEYENSYTKQIGEIYKYLMTNDDDYENQLIGCEALKSIENIDFDDGSKKLQEKHKCIHYRKRFRQWAVRITRNKSEVTIGKYNTLDEAKSVYKMTEGKTLDEIYKKLKDGVLELD
jgi:hypothetical protein